MDGKKGETMSDWHIYKGTNKEDKEAINKLPNAPKWRKKDKDSFKVFKPEPKEIDLVNAALYLRRPLLITGKPGVGKTALAKSVAYELGLGDLLTWHITTQSTLKDALYSYDAVARLHDASIEKSNDNGKRKKRENIGKYITLGALGTAFTSKSIRVVLIDEIDKSDIDLPNNLLHVLEENRFSIPELERSATTKHKVKTQDLKEVEIINGQVEIDPDNFPLIIMTSNGEREFPPAFMRRCLHLEMKPRKGLEALKTIVSQHFDLTDEDMKKLEQTIEKFDNQSTDDNYIPVDKLLNALFLELQNIDIENNEELLNSIWKALLV